MRRIRWFAIVTAVMAMALVGVACGGDDTSSDSSSPGDGSPLG